MLEMLLKELPSSVRNALSIRVNAEKDTIVATRIVQRWRKPSNPISNTVGSISDKIDFLISAPYADKLPPKVAELIRKDIPFAVLLPLSRDISMLIPEETMLMIDVTTHDVAHRFERIRNKA